MLLDHIQSNGHLYLKRNKTEKNNDRLSSILSGGGGGGGGGLRKLRNFQKHAYTLRVHLASFKRFLNYLHLQWLKSYSLLLVSGWVRILGNVW